MEERKGCEGIVDLLMLDRKGLDHQMLDIDSTRTTFNMLEVGGRKPLGNYCSG